MSPESALLWDLYDKERIGMMSRKFFIEGHRSKSGWEDESTLVMESDQGFATLDEATSKAREYFEKEKDLGLMVIYKMDAEGGKEGIKFIFKNDEGNLEESLMLY